VPVATKQYFLCSAAYPEGFIDDDGTDLSGIVFFVGMSRTHRKDPGFIKEVEGQAVCYHTPGTTGGVIYKIKQSNMWVKWEIIFETDNLDQARRFKKFFVGQYTGPYLTNTHHNHLKVASLLK
jgi:hypothetical protein